MPSQVITSVENNFTKGLITEFTGLNFPENAATDTDNCVYTLVGNVTRRLGVDKELNGIPFSKSRTNNGLSDYKWDLAGGDGLTQLVVRQVGSDIYFYKSSAVTATAPLSTQKLATTVNLLTFIAINTIVFDFTAECQYADGNGYLLIFHPNCEPIYCTYAGNTVTATSIPVQVRDFTGYSEPIGADIRPPTSILTAEHGYNLGNQGWITVNAWTGLSTTPWNSGAGNVNPNFTVAAGLVGVSPGQTVQIVYTGPDFPGMYAGAYATGTVTSYAGTTLVVHAATFQQTPGVATGSSWTIYPISLGYASSFGVATGSFPSNSDVWWRFKNSSGVFDPATTANNFTPTSGNAPKGHYILNAFNQNQSGVSGQPVTNITTTSRPRTGAWFAGRAWFTGVDAQQAPTGDAAQYTWTENIYFSQIVQSPTDLSKCYQQNDPTSETLFDLLPTDGGIITILGSGNIYKLFPIQNGLLVFASNGIWFITGSRGIGFSANDYTVTNISYVRSISSTSFINVNGLPYFWNEEGIYMIQPSQQGGLEVNPITVGTILSFYNEIPVTCKKYVRGAYHPIDYVIQWVYRDTEFANATDRYSFNRILNYNTYNKAFYPYTIDATTTASINGILYVSSPGTVPPSFKYPSSSNSNLFYAEEYDISYKDWVTVTGGINYTSFFVTGYKVHGQAQRHFQIPYIYMYSGNDEPTSYKIQGLWDYAITGNSGKWSTLQLVNNLNPNFAVIIRKHRIRGRGLILQFKLQSTDGEPFNIFGWSTFETQNMSI